MPLEELLGTRYQRAFDLIPISEEEAARGWTVVADEYVTTSDGSGLVQTSPAYGAEDLAVGQRYDTPVLHPVGLDGKFGPETGWLAGRFVKAADADLVEDLRRRGLLWRAETHPHAYPFCWRCGTPLIYYALTSWYARTTAVKDRLLAENAGIGWRPEHIRDGRFGDWLANNVDWALSRARYWGTPLPLWRCAEQHVTVVESLADLSAKAGRDLSGLDPHRPFVDEVTFACPECGQEARRVPDVLDAWFDSGSMPFAQWGYPHTPEGRAAFERAFPADFISEGLDQTRGWFYSLLAVSTLLFDQTSFRNVVCLGLIVDRNGRKMSKSLGNVLDPFQLLDRYGADPLRWFMLASGSPWVSRRLFPEAIEDVTRSLFLTLWNTFSFFTLYARLAGFDPTRPAAGAAPTPLDRWVLAELADTVDQVTRSLDDYDATSAARRLAGFVDDLSNWYVRLSRRRFWRGTGEDADAAFGTLWTCLRTVAVLLAPYAPFTAEELWQGLVVSVDPEAPDSVHLVDWPEPDPGRRRPGAERGHGRGPAAGRPRPPGPHRGQAEDPPAPGQGPDRRARPGQGRGDRAAGPGRGRAERQAGRLRRGRGRAGRLPAGPQLPGPRAPVRARRPGGGRRPAPGPGRGGRRAGPQAAGRRAGRAGRRGAGHGRAWPGGGRGG